MSERQRQDFPAPSCAPSKFHRSGEPNKWLFYLYTHTKLNNPWIKEEIKRGLRKHSELNNNENPTHQNLRGAVTVVLGGGGGL